MKRQSTLVTLAQTAIARLRYTARILLQRQADWHSLEFRLGSLRDDAIRRGDRKCAASIEITIEEIREQLLDIGFSIIVVGQVFLKIARELDAALTIDQVCDALNVNPVHRRRAEFTKYGTSTLHIVSALRQENTATGKFDSWRPSDRPLVWCCEMALLHELGSNPTLEQRVYEEANRIVFNGQLGNWRKPTVLERCGVAGGALI